MPQTGETTNFRQYFVVFTNADRLPWYTKPFVKPGFEHCYIILPYEKGSVIITQTVRNIEIYTSDYAAIAYAYFQAEQKHQTVVYINKILQKKPVKITIRQFLPSCVSLCQRVIGMEATAVTPYGLYKKLLKQGGVQLGVDNGRSI